MQVEVRVRDGDGNTVRGLTAEDFHLREDGTSQPVISADFIPEPARLAPLAESDTASEAGQEAVTTSEPPRPQTPRLWVYISNQSLARDFADVSRAIDRFLREDMREGMAVSLGGLAFTTDRARLMGTLERMRRTPNGGGSRKRGTWLPSSVDQTAENLAFFEFERMKVNEVDNSGSAMTTAALPIDNMIELNERIASFQLLGLVRELSALPGKKAVLLFRNGLRWEQNNIAVNEQLVGEAVRHRVSFYTMDSRGLEELMPATGTREQAYRKLRRGTLTGERLTRIQDSQHGLTVLAGDTGGAAAVNTNDFGLAFENMVRDAGGYYLVSYRPANAVEDGLVRRIRVDVDAPGAKVSYARKYYEEKSFDRLSKSEREVHLYRALQFEEASPGMRLRFDGGFFRSADGWTTFAFAAGMHPSGFESSGDTTELRYSVAALAEPWARDSPSAYEGLQSLETYAPGALVGALTDPNAFVQFRNEMRLTPGRHDWKIAWRDDRTGKVGKFTAELDVPALTEAESVSSILLTRRSKALTGEEETGLFDVAGMRLEPESPLEFRPGDRLFVFYEIYQASEEMLAAPPDALLALMHGEQPMELRAQAESFADSGAKKIRVLAAVETEGLAPGEYTVVALLPNAETRKTPYIHQSFRLIE